MSIPIDLFPAQRTTGVSLRMLSADGAPLVRRYFCSAEDTPLDNDQLVRGYELDSGEYVIVTDEELEALDPKKTRDIDLRRFVDRKSLDPLYFERAYFLAPGAESSKAYRLLAEVMERKGCAGIATFVLRDKEYVLAITAQGGLLRGETLRFHDEVRSSADVGLPKKVAAPRAAVRKLSDAIERAAADELDPDELAEDAKRQLLELAQKKHGKGIDVLEGAEVEQASSADVIDLMAVLKRSLHEPRNAAAKVARAAPARRKPAPAARRSPRQAGRKKAAKR